MPLERSGIVCARPRAAVRKLIMIMASHKGAEMAIPEHLRFPEPARFGNAAGVIPLVVVSICLGAAQAAGPAKPDFGPNVFIFDPKMPAAAIQNQIDKAFAVQKDSQSVIRQ